MSMMKANIYPIGQNLMIRVRSGMAEMKEIIKTGLFAIFMIVFLYFLSWILTCGVIKLITVCFGWKFKCTIATGIWLIMCVMENIFSKTINAQR